MRIRRITENSYQLTRLKLINTYLVKDADGWTLIDTGVPGTQKGILQAAAQVGVRIGRILLTHAHGDHVGSVDALRRALPADTALIASERSVPLLAKPPDKRLRPGEPQGKCKGSLPGINTRPTQLIGDGDRVGSLVAIATPGHIPGHLSFLDERDGTLFTGDALIAVREVRVPGDAPWYFPLPNLATWDVPLAIQSARKLAGLPIERIASGHGQVREVGRTAIEAAIAHAERAQK